MTAQRAHTATPRLPAGHRARSHPALLGQLSSAVRRAFEGSASGWDPSPDRRERPDLGRGLLDIYAMPLHVLWTYQEAWAHEGFLATARMESSRQRLLELVAVPPTPGLAATGLQHFTIKPGRRITLPPEFRLTAPASGGQKPAEFETLAAADLSHEKNAFLPLLPAGPAPPPSTGSVAYSAELLAPEVSVPTEGLLPELERRLAAGFAGDIARRNAERQRARALARAETLRELQDTGAIDPFSQAFQELCAGVCEAQRLANEVPPDAPFAPLSESQEMLLGQLGKIARRQPAALAGLESALGRQTGESDADWSRRLDHTTGFLDALVTGLMQEARDQMARLHGPGRFAQLDRALAGDGRRPTPARGHAPVGTDTLFLLSSLDPATGASTTQTAHLKPGDWLVVAETRRRVTDGGQVEETVHYRETVQVMRVGEDLPAGHSLPMAQIAFRPPLSRAYALSDVELIGNLVPVSHGRTVRRTVTRSQIRADGLLLTDEPLTWLPDPRAAGGRRTQVSLRIVGQDWTEVPIAAAADAEPGAFFLTLDATGVARIRIGAGDIDAPIPPDARIEISYRVGSGPEGNRPAMAVNEAVNTDSAIAATFNPLAMAGGTAPEVTDPERRSAIAASILDRAVSIDDVRRLALGYGSVGKAAVRRFRRRGAVVEARERLEVVVAAHDGTAISDADRADLAAFLAARVPPGVVLSVANRVELPVMARLRLSIRSGADPLEVIGEARRRLGLQPADPPGLLDPARVRLGQDLHLSDLHAALAGISDLAFIHVLAFHRAAERPQRADRIAVADSALPVWAAPGAGINPVELLWEEARDL